MKVIHWKITDDCNYRCPYCIASKVSTCSLSCSGEVSDPQQMREQWNRWSRTRGGTFHGEFNTLGKEKWIALWKKLHDMYGFYRISIIGGEPLAFPDFLEILEEANKVAYLDVATNFSLSKEEAHRLAARLNPERLCMITTYHPGFTRLDDFIEKLKIFKDAGFQFPVRFVGYPPLFPQVPRVREAFENLGVEFILLPFVGTYEGKRYPGQFKHRDDELSRELYRKSAGLAKMRNYGVREDDYCTAGHEFMYIDPYGYAFLCPVELNKCLTRNTDTRLGNAFDAGFKMNDGAVKCDFKVPSCDHYWCDQSMFYEDGE
ncbi:MAG: radical SAM/SPASM domain-containing protein [Endomicrobiales bacterium]